MKDFLSWAQFLNCGELGFIPWSSWYFAACQKRVHYDHQLLPAAVDLDWSGKSLGWIFKVYKSGKDWTLKLGSSLNLYIHIMICQAARFISKIGLGSQIIFFFKYGQHIQQSDFSKDHTFSHLGWSEALLRNCFGCARFLGGPTWPHPEVSVYKGGSFVVCFWRSTPCVIDPMEPDWGV